jgi:uncharacterized short protein YbdD (DUF466 family)
MKKLKWLKGLIRNLNGNPEYQKYLDHLKDNHPNQKVLSKRGFFAKKEKDKWGKINRCC